jgi:hypothetical protein
MTREEVWKDIAAPMINLILTDLYERPVPPGHRRNYGMSYVDGPTAGWREGMQPYADDFLIPTVN